MDFGNPNGKRTTNSVQLVSMSATEKYMQVLERPGFIPRTWDNTQAKNAVPTYRPKKTRKIQQNTRKIRQNGKGKPNEACQHDANVVKGRNRPLSSSGREMPKSHC